MSHPSAAPLWVVGAFVLVAAALDIWRFRIPNALTIPALLAGLAYHLLHGGWSDAGASLAGAIFGVACLVALYAIGVMGAGDLKLLAAVGAWLGLPATFCVFVIAALAAGAASAVILLGQGQLGRIVRATPVQLLQLVTLGKYHPLSKRVEAAACEDRRRTRLIPFAAMIAIGVATLCWQVYRITA